MIDELGVARAISDGTLPSPQHFGASWYWAIRISGVGCAWRESVNEFCWRERRRCAFAPHRCRF
jgi:hypothetical protein